MGPHLINQLIERLTKLRRGVDQWSPQRLEVGTRDEVAHDSNDGGGDLGNSIIIISILIRELRDIRVLDDTPDWNLCGSA